MEENLIKPKKLICLHFQSKYKLMQKELWKWNFWLSCIRGQQIVNRWSIGCWPGDGHYCCCHAIPFSIYSTMFAHSFTLHDFVINDSFIIFIPLWILLGLLSCNVLNCVSVCFSLPSLDHTRERQACVVYTRTAMANKNRLIHWSKGSRSSVRARKPCKMNDIFE